MFGKASFTVVHVDLNLLVALDALLEENSVAAAAERLNLSAPAMSRTLARIRRATGDDILVRSGRSMVPTARALELREEARELVRRASVVLTPPRDLDLSTLDRQFTVRGHDALLGALAGHLISQLSEKAPQSKVSLLAETDTDRPDLTRGHVDLELGSTVPDKTGISYEVLGKDRIVLALRRGHPMAGRRLTLQRLAEMDHVTISRRGRVHGVLDEALAERGLKRRVLASLPTSAAALDVVAGSDAVVVVAERVCAPLASRLGVVTRPVPVDLPPVEVVMSWHHRHDSDPAHAWLRGEVRVALAWAATPLGAAAVPPQ
jgi:DNA-binding transcriptional LysR family regulator